MPRSPKKKSRRSTVKVSTAQSVASKRPPAPALAKRRFHYLPKGAKNPFQLPKARLIARQSGSVLWHNRKLFVGIMLVYFVLTLLLVRDFSGTVDVTKLQTLLSSGRFAGSLGAFTLLVGSATSSNSQVAGVYRSFLVIVASLAIIWALRQVMAGAPKIRIRDAYYQGMYPLVPLLLVTLTIGLQLLPLVLGAGLYSLVVSNGIAASMVEYILWGLLALVSAAVSFYMVISSVFALYIVALPDMTPMRALRSARSLVRYRRWIVLRTLLFLPLILCIIALLLVLPVILTATVAAPFVLFFIGMLFLPIVHAYLYSLYRELLK
jgi:hypothetical protein